MSVGGTMSQPFRAVRRAVVAVATVATFVAAAPAALADNVVNTVDATVDAALESRTMLAGGSTSVGFYLTAENSVPIGDRNGCNANAASPASVTLSLPVGVTALPNPVTLVGCGSTTAVPVTFSSTTPGSNTIAVASVTGGRTGSLWNTAPAAFTLEVISPDSTAPVITRTVTGTMGANGWYTSDVTVDWTVTDPESAFSTVGCSDTTVSADTPSLTLTCQATSAGGTANDMVTLKRDATAPTITASVTPLASGGWWNLSTGAPTVSYACTDATSGVASCPGSHEFGEGAGQSHSGTAVDDAGNAASTAVTAIDVDLTAPVVSPVLPPVDGDNGWYTSDVIVTWTVDGGTSGPGNPCASDVLDADTANGSVACTEATDGAGNPGAGSFSGILRDATAPSVSAAVEPAAAVTGWWNASTGAPTVTYTCSDATSGTASCSGLYTFPEGAGLAHTGTAVDTAGNTTSTTVSDIDVDLTAPAVAYTLSGATGANGWFVSSLTVDWTATDDGSGIVLGCADETLTDDTTGTTRTCTATDAAGNSTTVTTQTLRIDTTPPTITATVSPAANAAGWRNQLTRVSFSCTDATSGVAVCPADVELLEGPDQSAAGTATDEAGHTATATATGIDVDLTAPEVLWLDGPTDGGSYVFGAVPGAPSCAAADTLSGPAGCVVTGYGTSVGQHTVTAVGRDLAGNSTTRTRTYTVLAWTLRGFYQPVDMGGVFNTVKAGSTVPMKFEVFAGATELSGVSAVASFAAAKIACSSGVVEDAVELVATGGTTLRYDAAGGQFIQNWQTPKSVGSCYRTTMTTTDGSSLTAQFKLK